MELIANNSQLHMEAILFSIFTFFSTLAGGLFGIRHKEKLHYIMSFSAGVLLAVCFFDILPEAIEVAQSHNLSLTPLFIAIVCGFLFFHVGEKTALIHTSHEHEYSDHKHPVVGRLGALGLAFHSLLDGVGIGLGFHIDPHVGILIAIAVIAHDFSDGLNTITFILSNKDSVKKAIAFLLIDALAPIVGVLSTYFFTISSFYLVIYLGFFAGFLLYIGASDLLPEAHSKHSSFNMIGLTIMGAAFIFAVTRFT